MKKFSEYIVSEKEITIEEFMDSVEKNFYKHFPNGFINLKYSTNLSVSITGTFGMIGDVKDQVNKIVQNDKMYHSFIMFLEDVDAGIWSFKASQSKIYIKPAEGSYNAMDSIKTKMGNNSKITLEKADKKLQKFFKKLSDIMKENKDNIAGVEKIDKKYLVFK
jgi:hypothetical protein